ncbi:uncharacterized protein [Apostichopus japonicus]
MSKLEELIEKIKEENSIAKYGKEILNAVSSTNKDTTDDEVHDLCDAIENPGLENCQKSKGKHADILIKICTEGISKQRIDYYKLAKTIFESKHCVDWKGKVKEAETIVDILNKPVALVRTKNDDWRSKDREPADTEIGEALQGCIEHMIEAFVRDKIIKKVNKKIMGLLIASYKRTDEMGYVLGCGIHATSDMNYDGTEGQLPELYTAMLEWCQREGNDISDWSSKSRFVGSTISSIGQKGVKAPDELSKLFNYIIEQDLDGQPMSGYGTVAMNILTSTVMQNSTNKAAIKPFIPGAVKLMKCENDLLEEMAANAIGIIYQQTELLIPCADTVMEVYLEGKGSTLGLVLQPLYKDAPEKVMKHFDQLAEKAADDMDDSEKTYFYMFLGDVAKREPKRIVPILGTVVPDLESTSCVHLAYMAIAEVAAVYPGEVEKYSKQLLDAWEKNPMTVASACKTIANIGRMNEKMADKYLTLMAKKLKTIDPMWKTVILMEMKRIGQAHKEPLKKHRAAIEAEKNGTQMGLPDMVQSIIDFLEDRTLENVSTNVAEQKEQIGELDTRVTGTENDVKRLDEEVTEQGEKLEDVQNEVTEQGDRLETLEVVVDETVEKVEEIDHKTITNAPKWSRDVSKILNPEHEYDWRYLAIRLGYSGEDVRNWALSPDPTMAILAEWYTTHKSSDATYAILTALQDMGRTEAAEIVEKALEEADQMVPKPVGEMSDKPCPVFISYQWDHQLEVKAVKDHLEMAGYGCWLDIGQMGGGDQLFAKINEGMRAAKLVLCMVTTKYAKSENCNKEVNLANLLNKPIIPILIENIPWPPEGSMSMLFAQLLYIQFFSEGEYVRGKKFWPDDRFHELLGQIGYYATPDPEMVTEEYQNWLPQIDDAPEVKVVKKAEQTTPSQSNGTTEETDRHPTVFISYQWDKQPQIKKLFSELTKLGFPCWLDIMQMGGGDPLFAKIDKGIRNAEVVLSCVTSKYALSANCRREVSLSDALRKPIIPLLLEEGMTWPPPGPMSMTFTQLLYIDFTQEVSQRNFEDEKFNELVSKIKDYVQPDEVVIETSEESTPPPAPAKSPVPTPSSNTTPSPDVQEEAKPVRPSSVQSMPERPGSAAVSIPERPSSSSPKPKKKKSSVCSIV